MTSSTAFREQLRSVYERAQQSGTILPLQIESQIVVEGALQHDVTWISSISLKDLAKALQSSGTEHSNPFLPYEPELFVSDISATHIALLNKFPISDQQVMAVTREYVEQTEPLSKADFHALAFLLRETNEGYAIFNGGKVAGASQSHRHIHVIPDRQPQFAHALASRGKEMEVTTSPDLPFRHALVRWDDCNSTEELAQQMEAAFNAAFSSSALTVHQNVADPFNLIATRTWLALIPRTQETGSSDGLSVPVNALHFGGQFIVRGMEEIDKLHKAGLGKILRAVT